MASDMCYIDVDATTTVTLTTTTGLEDRVAASAAWLGLYGAIIAGSVALLVTVALAAACRARAVAGIPVATHRQERLAPVNLPPGLGWTTAGRMEANEETAAFRQSQVLEMVLDRQGQAAEDDAAFIWRRAAGLAVLFVAYVATCLAVPIGFYNSLTCEDGLPWAVHFIFLGIFLATKAFELYLYHNDPTLANPLPALIQYGRPGSCDL